MDETTLDLDGAIGDGDEILMDVIWLYFSFLNDVSKQDV